MVKRSNKKTNADKNDIILPLNSFQVFVCFGYVRNVHGTAIKFFLFPLVWFHSFGPAHTISHIFVIFHVTFRRRRSMNAGNCCVV